MLPIIVAQLRRSLVHRAFGRLRALRPLVLQPEVDPVGCDDKVRAPLSWAGDARPKSCAREHHPEPVLAVQFVAPDLSDSSETFAKSGADLVGNGSNRLPAQGLSDKDEIAGECQSGGKRGEFGSSCTPA